MPTDTSYSFDAAFQRQRPRILAVSLESVRPINLDIASAGALVLGVVPKIAAHHAQLAALPGLDMTLIDSLEEIAMATLQSHADWTAATAVNVPLPELSEEATLLREQLASDARSMVLRKLMDATSIDDLKGGKGYRNTAMDLLTLASAFRNAWPRVQGRTAATEDDLARARSLGAQILRAIGERESSESDTADVTLLRARAFTLLVRAYDELRRGLAFLRHAEGDLEAIAPSLYAGKQRSKSSDEPPHVLASGVLPARDEKPNEPNGKDLPPISKDGPFR